ncbi:MAG: hypothetical protein KBF51_07880 [Chitinophagales bacterium]|nr:hypothetical protein [Chitinophagales bacterium]
MKILFYSTLCICFFCLNKICSAQVTYAPLNGYSYHLVERYDILDTGANLIFHTATKPIMRLRLAELADRENDFIAFNKRDAFNMQYLKEDNSEYTEAVKVNEKALWNFFYREDASLWNYSGEDFYVKINPVLNMSTGLSSDTTEMKYQNTRGIELRGGVDNKVGFYLLATDNQMKPPGYVKSKQQSQGPYPGAGISKTFKETGYDFSVSKGYIGINATKHISVLFGQDKLFIGDGVRSFVWSDNSNSVLFLRLNTNVWKINYQNNFMELIDYNNPRLPNGLFRKKYATMHHLSVNITEDVNVGLFETIVFGRQDSAGYTQGFEWQYFNPIIFYRAIEYGLGSPDNIMIGLNYKWNIKGTASLYGQVVMDEMKFFELVENTGWWANKYAVQAGLKYINAFKIANFDLQYEFNTIRPYMYSYYDNNVSSFTNYGQAIAHPIGANFNEHIISAWYQPLPKIMINNNMIINIFGADTMGTNWGGNIFKNYTTYEMEYGNTTGQGASTQLFMNDLMVSWMFWHNAFIDFRYIYRKVESEWNPYDTKETFFSIGLRLNAVPDKMWF